MLRGQEDEKKFSAAFGATICMASSYRPLVTKWARRTRTEETPPPVPSWVQFVKHLFPPPNVFKDGIRKLPDTLHSSK